jgi:uncharacterized membrane protein YraQ (UPF0718 family)
MKIRASLLAASAAAVIAYGVTFTDRGPHAPVATFVLGVFLAVLIGGLVLSVSASRADRRRDAEHGRSLAHSRAENERGIAAAEERRRSREARIARVCATHQDVHRGYRDPRAHFGDYQRLHRAQSAAKRAASRSEIAEAYSRCHPVRGLGAARCQL